MTTRFFLDTNVLLRYFLVDSAESPACAQLIAMAEDGSLLVATSSMVLLEMQFVLQKLYGFAREEAAAILELVLSIRNLQLVETTDSRQALEWHKDLNIKYADCLIASQVPSKAVFVSYDQEFKTFKQLQQLQPEQVIGFAN